MPISNPVVYCNPANIHWDLRHLSRQTIHFYSYFWTPSFRGTPALCVGFYAPEMYLQCMASVLCITHLNHCFSFIAYKKKYCNILKLQILKFKILLLHFQSNAIK